MSFSHVTIGDKDVILCRTGYTGEFGYELLPSWNDAADVWDALVEIITPMGGQVCGLGARDTLRTEMGYPLHGHELSLEIHPLKAEPRGQLAGRRRALSVVKFCVSRKAKVLLA